jgi:hypothetical protein
MKKKIFVLAFGLLGAGFILANPPNSATSTDSVRNHETIFYHDSTIVLDGSSNDVVWSIVAPTPIDRKYKGESPSLYSAFWKGFWNDTAVFILIRVIDDNFWPSWKSGQPDWASDKVELYMDVNGIIPDGVGGCCGQGHYLITHNYDTLPATGTVQSGSVAGTWEANTWEYNDPANLTTEWCIPFARLKNEFNITFNPRTTTLIGFDICVPDNDSTVSSRHRQMWSNIGDPVEDWYDLDSAGKLQLLGGGIIPPPPPPPITTADAVIKRIPDRVHPVIDGQADYFWTACEANNIDKNFTGETPTLNSATWKAVWNDTAVFVLIEVSDNDFWPSWKSGQPYWASDRIETYFDVNGIIHDGYGASMPALGHYLITHDYDTIPGIPKSGMVVGTFEANTWSFDHPAYLKEEWCIPFKSLKDSLAFQLDPFFRTQIGFDVYAVDLDSGQVARNRKVWSNTGENGENWFDMDSAGIIKFSTDTITVPTIPLANKADTITRLPEGCTLTIDGRIDNVWNSAKANPIARSFLGEYPSIASATWKAMWNDTAIFVLLQVVDNIFLPEYNSGETCQFFDRLAVYFDVNNTLNDGNGPYSSGNLKKGHYEIAPPFIENGNYMLRGSNGVHYAYYVDEASAVYTYEYSINFSTLKDAGGNQLNPISRNTIGFDAEVWDVDVPCIRNRLVWSNSGNVSENRMNMNDAGKLTFDNTHAVCETKINTPEANDLQLATLYPNPVKETLFSDADIDRVIIYSVLGQVIRNIDVYSNKIDLSAIPKGIYFINSYKNNEQAGSQLIIKE